MKTITWAEWTRIESWKKTVTRGGAWILWEAGSFHEVTVTGVPAHVAEWVKGGKK